MSDKIDTTNIRKTDLRVEDLVGLSDDEMRQVLVDDGANPADVEELLISLNNTRQILARGKKN